jgi:hypothetical protein
MYHVFIGWFAQSHPAAAFRCLLRTNHKVQFEALLLFIDHFIVLLVFRELAVQFDAMVADGTFEKQRPKSMTEQLVALQVELRDLKSVISIAVAQGVAQAMSQFTSFGQVCDDSI